MSKRRARKERRQASLAWLKMPWQEVRNPIDPVRLLSAENIEKIHNTSMWILENVGMSIMDKQALALWDEAGAKVDHRAQQVWLDRDMVLELVSKAPSQFTYHSRNPAYNFTIGGNHIAFTANSGMPFVTDLDRGRRNGSLADFEAFAQLAHTIPFFQLTGGTFCEPQDIAPSLRHLERMRVLVNTTDRGIRAAGHGYTIAEDEIEMARIAFGGDLPGCALGCTVNVTSPLRLDDRMVGGLLTYAKYGQVSWVTPFIMAGATSPITMAAALAQQNAEALGAIALAQLAYPGSPVIYGGFAQGIDMRSGSPAFGAPEGAWGILVGAQMARRYGLPYRSSGSLTNSNLPDAQAAYETQWSMWPAIMAHANLMMHAVGWLEGGLTASFEKFVIDAESLGMFIHFLNGMTVDEESLAQEAIAQIGLAGHHFGTAHTQARYETAFYEPLLTDRQGFEPWLNSGGEDVLQRANRCYKQLLQAYEKPPIDEAIVDALDAFVERRRQELAGVDLYE